MLTEGRSGISAGSESSTGVRIRWLSRFFLSSPVQEKRHMVSSFTMPG